MREVDNVKYYDAVDICETFFHNKIRLEEMIDYFDTGKLKGKMIYNEWHADKKAIDEFIENVFLKEKSYNAGLHRVDLSNITLNGKILDIGGGGQGIIGQFKGEQVIAIDPNKNELEEAPSSDGLKIIMDAKDLQFLDNTFDTATAFFTLMYIPKEEHKTIFQEIHRVLKKNGEFTLWDATIPNRNIDDERYIFFINLEVIIEDNKIETGYGALWNKEQNIEYFSNLGKNVGFEILESKEEEVTFYLRYKKK